MIPKGFLPASAKHVFQHSGIAGIEYCGASDDDTCADHELLEPDGTMPQEDDEAGSDETGSQDEEMGAAHELLEPDGTTPHEDDETGLQEEEIGAAHEELTLEYRAADDETGAAQTLLLETPQ